MRRDAVGKVRLNLSQFPSHLLPSFHAKTDAHTYVLLNFGIGSGRGPACPHRRPAGPRKEARTPYGPAYMHPTRRWTTPHLRHSTMGFILQKAVLFTYLLAGVAFAVSVPASLEARATSACTLTASGSDDAPAFLSATADSSCPTVTIPSGTTLSIQSKLNMTGISNKHIVCPSLSFLSFRVNPRWLRLQFTGPARDYQVQRRPRLLDGQRLHVLLPGPGRVLAPRGHEHRP